MGHGVGGAARGAIVVGGTANGVGVVRSLAARGIRVIVVRTLPQDIAQHSRYASGQVHLGREPDALMALLEERAREWRGWTVVPTNDHALEVLARERDRLARSYRLPVPPFEITRRVLDKELTRQAAIEVGIPVPRLYGPASPEILRQPDLQFPVVVKPLSGHLFAERLGRKLLLAGGMEGLATAVSEAERVGLACSVLEMIPGPDTLHFHYQTYRMPDGCFVGDFALRKLRQSPPFFGVARAAEPVDVPHLREPTYALLERLEWQGFASVCFKRDPRDGRDVLMEINGRSPLSHGLARRAGVDIPYMIYSGAESGRPEGIHPNGWQGVWIHLHADLLYAALYWREEGLVWREFLASYRRPKTFAVWSLQDPLPFLAEWWHTVRKAARRTERRGMLTRVQRLGPLPSATGRDEGSRDRPLTREI